MKWYRKHKMSYLLLFFVLAAVILIVVEFLIIKYNGVPVGVPNIPRDSVSIGEGKPLKYVILGDSTAVGQGGEYDQGIAVSTAQHIADKGNRVTYQNFAVSGAVVADVLQKQVSQAATEKPDVVLISIGANNVTHLTGLNEIEKDMNTIVEMLRSTNPNVKIIITGSPQMGSVPRFPQPAKYLAKVRTAQINKIFEKIAEDKNLAFARIAERTGPIFMEQPELFAADKFHPTTEGYRVWVPVLNESLDKTL